MVAPRSQRFIPLCPIHWDRRLKVYYLILPLLGITAAITLRYLQISNPFSVNFPEAVGLIVVFPIFEEILFRQGVYSLLMRVGARNRLLIFLTAITFGIYHLVSLLFLPKEYFVFVLLQACAAFAAGIVFGWARALTGSIIPSILLHSAFNGSYLIGTAILAEPFAR